MQSDSISSVGIPFSKLITIYFMSVAGVYSFLLSSVIWSVIKFRILFYFFVKLILNATAFLLYCIKRSKETTKRYV